MPLNPFQLHSNLMGQYQTMLDTPTDNKKEGDYVVYAGAKIKCVVGPFELQQRLLPSGGITNRLTGEAIIQKSALPNAQFQVGQKLAVAQVGGSIRYCEVEALFDDFLEWRVQLWDTAQAA